MRTSVSTSPPALVGTIILIGRSGNESALSPKVSPNAAIAKISNFIGLKVRLGESKGSIGLADA